MLLEFFDLKILIFELEKLWEGYQHISPAPKLIIESVSIGMILKMSESISSSGAGSTKLVPLIRQTWTSLGDLQTQYLTNPLQVCQQRIHIMIAHYLAFTWLSTTSDFYSLPAGYEDHSSTNWIAKLARFLSDSINRSERTVHIRPSEFCDQLTSEPMEISLPLLRNSFVDVNAMSMAKVSRYDRLQHHIIRGLLADDVFFTSGQGAL